MAVPQVQVEAHEPPVAAGRRELMADLTRALAPGSPLRVLAVIRLQGLSRLRERSGAIVRDRLVEQARHRALADVGPAGTVYVSRQDEVCVLLDGRFMDSIASLDRLTRAIDELGRPHAVAAEAGVALLPVEADDPISALQRADSRTVAGEYTEREGPAGRRGRRGQAAPARGDAAQPTNSTRTSSAR